MRYNLRKLPFNNANGFEAKRMALLSNQRREYSEYKGTLFHECVHHLQQKYLGIDEFCWLFWQDYLRHELYSKVNLQIEAEELERRFLDRKIFKVADELKFK